MNIEKARALALAMPDAEEHQHFQKIGYRTKARKTGGKPGKMFMTLGLETKLAVLFLTIEQQTQFHAAHPNVFVPVPNKWGEKGATFVELSAANEKLFKEALTISYHKSIAKPKDGR